MSIRLLLARIDALFIENVIDPLWNQIAYTKSKQKLRIRD